MAAAKQSQLADSIYITTDSAPLKQLANQEGIQVIDRPAVLSADDSELVDAIIHALLAIDQPVEIVVTMHCNCAVHLPGLVDACIRILLENEAADSVVSGHIDRGVHPYRTRKITPEGHLEGWFDVPPQTSSNRQNLEPCFILDGAARALRIDQCFPPSGLPPFGYLGRHVLPIENSAGGDVHSHEDIAVAEFQLRQLGWRLPGNTGKST
jgi:N-acylneuraminate cytidylyltransferase